MRSLLRGAVAISLALSSATCGANEPLPLVGKRPAEEVTLARLLAAPAKFNGSIVRVIALCTIALEGNALYLSEDDLRQSYQDGNGQSIWLQLGWPVSAAIRALDHKYVLVEGRFDNTVKGHEGMYAGAILEVRRIEQSSPEAEAEVRGRLDGRH